jgi:hypothetical protein
MEVDRKKVVGALDYKRLSRKHYEELLVEALPVGATVRWEHGRHVQEGTVHSVSYWYVFVDNACTGKRVRLEPTRILCYYEAHK